MSSTLSPTFPVHCNELNSISSGKRSTSDPKSPHFIVQLYRDRSLHRFDTVAECDGQADRVTDTRSKTDASTTAKMREADALHTVAREKSCTILNFARFDSLVCIVARSREKSGSLPFLACYRLLSLSLTGL